MKSTGHILFGRDVEYFEVPSGHIFQAPLSNGFDPDGYRHGATAYVYQDQRRDDLIRSFQQLVDDYPDGSMYCHVHHLDHDVIRKPNPDPDFLEFWRWCRSEFDLHPTIRGRHITIIGKNENITRIHNGLAGFGTATYNGFLRDYGHIDLQSWEIPEIVKKVVRRRVPCYNG